MKYLLNVSYSHISHQILNTLIIDLFINKISADLTLSRLLHKLLIVNNYLNIQNYKCLKIKNLKPLMLNVG